MKKILYVVVPLIVVTALLFVFLFQRKQKAEQSNISNDSSLPASLPAPTPESTGFADPITGLKLTDDKKLLEETPSGRVKLNNFARNAEIADNGIIYPIDKENYNIGYNSTSKEFIVTLLVASDIEKARADAENDLLAVLGISKEDACKINVYLYVSAALTEDKSLSQNHGLSFCPGGQSF
ncbi:MAG: hypothetical protein Q8L09_02760 [Candidatus Moranbacteria bacterium]|nr:hypothetical protein [Candidatus Moranbacteria bacterium]